MADKDEKEKGSSEETEMLFPKYLDSETYGQEPNLPTFLLQFAMKAAGYDADGQLEHDAVYGPMTEMAVEEFQKAHDLEPDGKFGPMTRELFLEELGININAIPKDLFCQIGHA